MPMDATPLEQVLVLADATYETGEPTVAPLLGLLTLTLANADAANARKTIRMEPFRKEEDVNFEFSIRCNKPDVEKAFPLNADCRAGICIWPLLL
jgi:hypothetical protein